MGQSCLIQFDKSVKNDFKKSFESEYIRQINFEDEEELIFSYKKCLDTKLIPNIKKKKLEYGVLISFYYKCSAEETGQSFIEKFDKKEQAIKFFNDDKEELGFLRKMDKENKLFDGRRYFWLVKGNEIIKKI